MAIRYPCSVPDREINAMAVDFAPSQASLLGDEAKRHLETYNRGEPFGAKVRDVVRLGISIEKTIEGGHRQHRNGTDNKTYTRACKRRLVES